MSITISAADTGALPPVLLKAGHAATPSGGRWRSLPPAVSREEFLPGESDGVDALCGDLLNAGFEQFDKDAPRWKAADIRELPPAPSSVRLFLSAMLSVGAWHLVRSARGIHFGALPEWYHEAAPDQIGYAVAFDLDFGTPRYCRFDRPADLRPGFARVPRDFDFRRYDQCFLTVVDTRGPPTGV